MNEFIKEEWPKGYIGRFLDNEILLDSTSGGIFTAIATYFINNGTVVFGAGYDEKMNVVFKPATDVEQLKEMRGSKFVQCYVGDTFKKIKELLTNDKSVAFFGTPCQVEGLLAFLGNKPDNLFCIDFVCRGVPSPKMWRNYLDNLEKNYDDKVVSAKFKNKTYGYHASSMKISFQHRKPVYGSGRVNPMMKAFVNELASRPSCSECAFKKINRKSDITMFDCYEYSKVTGLTDDNLGYSSILVHSYKGLELIKAISNNIYIVEADVNLLVKYNGIMVLNSALPNKRRSELYGLLDKYSLDQAMQKVDPITKIDILVENLKRVLYRFGVIEMVRVIRKQRSVNIKNE